MLGAVKLCLPEYTVLGHYTNVVGPPGFEPGTKGFACSEGFPPARTISSPFACGGWGAGRSSL